MEEKSETSVLQLGKQWKYEAILAQVCFWLNLMEF